jgi:tRNA pseudouridine55 synthase
MRAFEGEILQVPPPYSAKKFAGKPLYKWARGQKPVTCPPRPVSVHAFRLVEFRTPVIGFEVRCGSGTYIRSLAHSLGERLGCGAHLAGLRRLSAGDLTVDRALSVERVEELIKEGKAGEVVRPLEALLPGLPKVVLTEAGADRVQKGRVLADDDILRVLPAPDAENRETYRIFNLTGRFLGLAQPGPQADTFVPFLVLAP